MNKSTLVFLLPLICCSLQLWSRDFRIIDFGARPDGTFLNTRTIQHAIDFVQQQGGGRLIFEKGDYLTGSFYLRSNVILHLDSGAVLLGSTNPFDYVKDVKIGWMAMIFAVNQENIGISGKGTINGQGFKTACNMVGYIHSGIVNDPLKYDRPAETNRPSNIYFRECRNVKVTGITLRDPASWNQTYDQCRNLLIDSIKVDSKSYWNNDGIDVVDCDSVVIRNSFFDAADDVICFKSHDPTKICRNVVVDNCTGRSSANGLKFGTVSRGGFSNFTVTNLTIYDTFRSAITFAAVDGGKIEHIVVKGVRAINTGNVIYLRIGDRWSSGKTPSMRDISISDVYAEVPAGKPDVGYNYEGPVEDLPRNVSPASIVGLPEYKIEDVKLKNIEIVYPGGSNPFYAFRGLTPAELDSIPEMRLAYPEFSQFKELPAWGFYIRHAKGIDFENVTLTARKKDYRAAMVMDDVTDAKFINLKISEPESQGKRQIFQYRSKDVDIKKIIQTER